MEKYSFSPSALISEYIESNLGISTFHKGRVNKNRDNKVLVRSKPSMVASKGLLTLTAWTNKDPSDTASNCRPLAVYAKLTQGQSPVLDAQIFLKINVRLLNGSVVTLPKMTLMDNRFGGEIVRITILMVCCQLNASLSACQYKV